MKFKIDFEVELDENAKTAYTMVDTDVGHMTNIAIELLQDYPVPAIIKYLKVAKPKELGFFLVYGISQFGQDVVGAIKERKKEGELGNIIFTGDKDGE